MGIKKDQSLVMLSGKESDYEIVVHARALCDFNSDAQIGEFKKLLDPDRDPRLRAAENVFTLCDKSEARVWGAVERQKHLSVLLRVTQRPQFATGNCIRHRE